jgi:hypothetical protein
VQDRVLDGGQQDLHLTATRGLREQVDVVEELTPRHLLDRPGDLHEPVKQRPPTVMGSRSATDRKALHWRPGLS